MKNMPEILDLVFFEKIADNPGTPAKIREIHGWQERMLRDNEMPVDASEISLGLNGREIVIEASSAVNALEIYQEIFRDNDHGVITEFMPGSDTETVVDLGANYGFYALWVKKYSPHCRVLCVEPNAYVFPFLQRNLSGYEGIVPVNKAVGKTDGWEDFDIIRQVPSIAGKTLRMTPRSWVSERLMETRKVETIRIETLFHLYDINRVDIMKVDIEGAEKDLFMDTPVETLRKVRRIVVERHSAELREYLLSRLGELGFELVHDCDPHCTRHYGNMFFINSRIMRPAVET